MWNRKDIKKEGKAAVKRNYWKAVLVSFLFVAIMGGSWVTGSASQNSQAQQKVSEYKATISSVSPTDILIVLGSLLFVFIIAIFVTAFVKAILMNPLEVGITKFGINAVNGNGNISDLGEGFDVQYKRNVGTLFLRDIYKTLWTLLFIIPGIIKTYEYAMIPYILADNPNISRKEAFAKSKAMMKGNKWRAFVLDLSFILWHILGAITFGIVTMLYVLPYTQLTDAALYMALKKESDAN